MPPKWSSTQAGFQCNAGKALAEVQFASDSSLAVCGRLNGISDWGLERGFEMDSFHYLDSTGASHEMRARVANAYSHDAMLTLPLTLAGPVGLASTLQILADERCIEMQVRVQTVRPVERVWTEIAFSWQGLRFELPLENGDEMLPNHAYDRKRAGVIQPIRDSSPTCVLMADPGATGTIVLDNGTLGSRVRRLQFTLFHCPLEKGVILVGRIALCSWPLPTESTTLGRHYANWLIQRSFL